MDASLFAPACAATAAVVAGLRDDQLTGATPCPAYSVADLAEHVVGLTAEFTTAARKQPSLGEQRDGDAARLDPGWQDQLVADLTDLAAAWAEPGAFDGDTHAGPLTMPAGVAALVALDEVVVHGWDLAVATGQPYDPDPTAVRACLAFVEGFDAPANDDGGLFGPPVTVADDADHLTRLVALTGRDPAWSPGSSSVTGS